MLPITLEFWNHRGDILLIFDDLTVSSPRVQNLFIIAVRLQYSTMHCTLGVELESTSTIRAFLCVSCVVSGRGRGRFKLKHRVSWTVEAMIRDESPALARVPGDDSG